MQPQIENHLITCLKCKGQSRVRIMDGKDVFYIDHTPIISCRLRGDMKWGFECQCGNDSRLAREEKADAGLLVHGGEHALEKLIDSLKIKDKDKFIMESN